MERLLEGSNASSLRFLKTTPEALRQLASRLELQAKEATLPGQVVTYAATKDLTIVYDPHLSLGHWKKISETSLPPILTDGVGLHPDELEGGP